MEDDLLKVFVQESKEHLDYLEPTLLELEEYPSQDSVNAFFRAVHSLKGSSGFFGLENISKLSHQMENAMSLVREGKLQITKELTDIFLVCTDKLKIMVDDVNNQKNVQIQNEINAVKAIISGEKPPTDAEVVETTTSEPEQPKIDIPENLMQFRTTPQVINELVEQGRTFYIATIETNNENVNIEYFSQLETLGDIIDTTVDYSAIKGLNNFSTQQITLNVLFATLMQPDLVYLTFDVNAEKIDEIKKDKILQWIEYFRDGGHQENEKEPVQAIKAASPVSLPQVTSQPQSADIEDENTKLALAANNKKGDNTIRVSVSLLDSLMNLAGEMVLGRNQLMRMSEDVIEKIPGFASVLQQISLITSEMQEKVMLTRLQPINLLFNKFTRIVRDLSYKLNKDIRLQIFGKEVELDRSILEALSDPLTHLIRNCVDHGIEPPKEREMRGKSSFGTITLSAKHAGGQVHIEISDDGRGMDLNAIKEKSIAKGFVTKEKADQMSEQEIANLIFFSGVSTAEKVSDISGRGVGMDVVKTNIERLNGTVAIDTKLGEGSRFSLRLPLTLAIIPAMIIGIKDRKFAVPQINLEEIVQLDENHTVETIRGTPVLRLRGSLLPLVDLQSLMKMSERDNVSSATTNIVRNEVISKKLNQNYDEESVFILVLKVDNKRFGLIVNEIYDNEEIVVKPLCSYLKNTLCYAGATLMGDGKVAMILDTDGIAKLAELCFSDFESKDTQSNNQWLNETNEQQSLILFKAGTEEVFAMSLSLLSRIEHIKAEDIQEIGNDEFLEYGDTTLRLVRLDKYMSINPSNRDAKEYFVLVPQLVKRPMGILATSIEDVLDAKVTLDEETIRGVGILGSTILNKNLTIFLDLYNLFEHVDPTAYKGLDEEDWPEDFHNKKLLLAEDTAFFRIVVHNYLSKFFNRIDVVTDGAFAWEKLNINNYDIVVTDLEMPRMNGFQLIENIRTSERLNKLPVVALTAFCNETEIERGKRAGFDTYEIKFDKGRIIKTLKEILTKK